MDVWHLDLAVSGLVLGGVAAVMGREPDDRAPAVAPVVAGALAVAVAGVAPLVAVAAVALALVVAVATRGRVAVLGWVVAGTVVVAASPAAAWSRPTAAAAVVVLVVVGAGVRAGVRAGPVAPAGPVAVVAMATALAVTWAHVPDTEGAVALAGATLVPTALGWRRATGPSVAASGLLLVLVATQGSAGRPASVLALGATTALLAGALALGRTGRPRPVALVALPALLAAVTARTVGIAEEPRPVPAVLLAGATGLSWALAWAQGRRPRARAGPGGPGTR